MHTALRTTLAVLIAFIVLPLQVNAEEGVVRQGETDNYTYTSPSGKTYSYVHEKSIVKWVDSTSGQSYTMSALPTSLTAKEREEIARGSGLVVMESVRGNAPDPQETEEVEESGGDELFFETPGALSGSKFTSVSNVVEWLFNVAITIGAIALIVLLLVGGVIYLTNAGNEDGTKKAFRLMTNAVIGLVLILIAWALGTYVLELLGLRLS